MSRVRPDTDTGEHALVYITHILNQTCNINTVIYYCVSTWKKRYCTAALNTSTLTAVTQALICVWMKCCRATSLLVCVRANMSWQHWDRTSYRSWRFALWNRKLWLSSPSAHWCLCAGPPLTSTPSTSVQTHQRAPPHRAQWLTQYSDAFNTLASVHVSCWWKACLK